MAVIADPSNGQVIASARTPHIPPASVAAYISRLSAQHQPGGEAVASAISPPAVPLAGNCNDDRRSSNSNDALKTFTQHPAVQDSTTDPISELSSTPVPPIEGHSCDLSLSKEPPASHHDQQQERQQRHQHQHWEHQQHREQQPPCWLERCGFRHPLAHAVMLAVAQAAERDLRLYPPASAGDGAGAAATPVPYAAMLGLEGRGTSGSCCGNQQQQEQDANGIRVEEEVEEGKSGGTEKGVEACRDTRQRHAGFAQVRGGGRRSREEGESEAEPMAKRQKSQFSQVVVNACGLAFSLHSFAAYLTACL